MTNDTVEPLIQWLNDQRRINELQLSLMALHYDADGALSAGQWELAWRTRETMLIVGLRMYLNRCGLNPAPSTDHVEGILTAMAMVERIDGGLANDVWKLLERAAPNDEAGIRRELAQTSDFLRDRLQVPSAASRADATRAWADGTRLLREIAKSLGIAGTTDWYLDDLGAQAAGLDWYDQVISMVDQQVTS